MAMYAASAAFNAVDNISNVVGNIGDNVAKMGDRIQQQMLTSAQATGGLEGAFGTLAAVGIGPVIGILGAGIDQFMSLNSEMAGLSARTGMTGEALQEFKAQTQDAFANQGVITNLGEMARLVETVKTQTQNLANTDLTKFTGEVANLAKAYGLDPSGLADSVGKVQSKFEEFANASPEKTLDALLTVAQQTGEPLNTIADIATRYGTRLAAAGLTGLGAMALINTGLQNGITNFSDLTKGIEKFHEKAMNPPPAFKQALEDLNMSDIFTAFQEGRTSFESFLSTAFTQISAIEDPARRAKEETALFGGAMLKLDAPGVLAALSNMKTQLGDVEGASKRAANTMNQDFGTFVSTTWNKFTSAVSTGVDQVWNSLTHADWQGAMNQIKGVVEPAWDSIFGEAGFFRKAVPDAINGVIKFVGGIVGDIAKAFGSIASAILAALAPVVTFIDGLITKITSLGSLQNDPLVKAYAKEHPDDPFVKGLGIPGQAQGGFMDEGWNIVGEEGPEAVWKSGGRTQVFSNRETKQILGSGAGGTGRGTVIYLSAGMVVGSGGMQELARMLVPYQQREDQRRSTG